MYSKEYFFERFKNGETDDLLQRYATVDLVDEAKEAILLVLKSRGVDDSKLQLLVIKARKATYRQTKGTYECDFCNSSAKHSAVLNEGQRFCSNSCLQNARLLEVSEDIPKETILHHASKIKEGVCPLCQQSSSKTEVRRYYRVWSAVVLTEWAERSHICCHSCGWKTNLESIIFCMLFGWWGIPWGLIITPGQIISNIAEMFRAKAESSPSEELLRAARLELAAKLHE